MYGLNDFTMASRKAEEACLYFSTLFLLSQFLLHYSIPIFCFLDRNTKITKYVKLGGDFKRCNGSRA